VAFRTSARRVDVTGDRTAPFFPSALLTDDAAGGWAVGAGRKVGRSTVAPLPVPTRSRPAGDGGRAAPFEEGHHVPPVGHGVGSPVGGHHSELPQPAIG
jgi:hypothetical protein